MEFKNKTALISGAASGMGLLCAQELAAQGANVVLTDINLDAVSAAAKDIRDSGGQAMGLQVDVRHYQQVETAVDTAVKQYGEIDLLLNFAGGAETRVLKRTEPFYELPVEAIDWGLDVNLKGTVYLCRAVMGGMVKQKKGVIINLGSVAGVVGASTAVNYSTAKSGIIGLTKSLAMCGAPHGVRVCCVSPGPVLTREHMAKIKTRVGRAADPKEIVDLILYLCSDKAAFITGSNYLIDGGRTLGPGIG
jgi:NAD(P)-dependent dehydrogenase (short-subunit alcohol dehydrogenase family)